VHQNAQISPKNFSCETPDFLFAASRLQQSEITAGVKLQKGSLGVSDLCAMPEKLNTFCGKVIKFY